MLKKFFYNPIFFLVIIIAVIMTLAVLIGQPVSAFDLIKDGGAGETANDSGYNKVFKANNFSEAVGKIINFVLSFVGIFFLVLTLYGGVRWMISQGNDTEVENAKKIIKSALIGLVIVLGAYFITWLAQQLFYAQKEILYQETPL
ncbi:hypothetical protein COX69_04525 [Candidatus Falkowbacteria bacterium CG_4_10_14_0_2_um_filter_48_10]|uniref:Uncharacterized protein n=1 Tax=Candidatus Falkowbacteria bacterium CG23_combo_of_CG06-09_8_20_14_all_49_15 TaxID=1974572 RepID=A0A2G9ZL10_9BACT|nr:MAG: hypothetical protein COX22_02035 [Candidatus Falkowbacteria bacterium CG23_combo_of_CG06-09_8_20_14_all_49_15]PJA07523.1 MAG: hypothetical protein COX69_04525 [Candidatus Falkowbacteria bacterium CG_4_10_14_0_2_um_filter_48_10]